MKPQPRQELEQLLDEAELEQEALAEREASRTHPDISQYVLDVPRDVKGLIELVEERKKLLEVPESRDDIGSLATSLGALIGLSSLIPILFYDIIKHGNKPLTSEDYWLFAPVIVGALTGYLVDAHRLRKEKKEFQQQKEENQPKLESLKQKLLHYEKKCVEEDIVLVHDQELGYSVGHIQYSGGKPILYQKYWEHQGVKQRLIDDSMEIDSRNIISILSPHTTLSVDDIKSLPPNTALLCGEKYGFVGGITGEDFRLYIDSGLKYHCHTHTFQQVEEGKITPRILVPEIKPIPHVGGYRV